MDIFGHLSYLQESLWGKRRNNTGYGRRPMCEWTVSALHSIIAILTRRWGRFSLVSLLRSLHDDILTTFGPLWRISDVIVSRQAGDFVPAQVGVRIRRSMILDQDDLTERIWCYSRSLGMRGVSYLVKEDMGHTVSRVNCDHTVKVGLGFFEKALG